MDVLEEYVKIEKLDPTQVPDSAVKHKEDSFGKMTSEFSAVESSGKQFIKDATDVCAPRLAPLRSVRGVGTAGATGALAPAMLKPRGREYLAPAIFYPHFCMLFLKLPLFVVMLPTYN